MIWTTRTIDPSHTKLMIGHIHEDGDVDAVTPTGMEVCVPRFMIETPVLRCRVCGQPARLLIDKKSKKEMAECPDYARHMYDQYFSASHDFKRFTRKQRRDLHKKAHHWLNTWRRTFEARIEKEKAQATAQAVRFNQGFKDGVTNGDTTG